MKNGDIAGANACLPSIPSNTGFRIPPGGNCQMTYYWRSDSRSPTGTPNSMLTLSLEKQPSQNNSYIDIAGAGFGWWIYFTNYAYSEMAGWIKLNLSIRDYNLPSYLLSGFGESETF